MLNTYFYSVFLRVRLLYLNLKTCLKQILMLTPSILLKKFSVLYYLFTIYKKAIDIDGISPAVLINYAIVLTKPLHYLFSCAIFCRLSSK